MTTEKLICAACFRTTGEWHQKTAAVLAAEIVASSGLSKCDLNTFYQGVIAQAGVGAVADIRKAWDYPSWVDRFERALEKGDMPDAQSLWDTRPVAFDAWAAGTLTAIQATLDARKVRLVDVVADQNFVNRPGAIQEADVLAALTDSGFSWNGAEWEAGV